MTTDGKMDDVDLTFFSAVTELSSESPEPKSKYEYQKASRKESDKCPKKYADLKSMVVKGNIIFKTDIDVSGIIERNQNPCVIDLSKLQSDFEVNVKEVISYMRQNKIIIKKEKFSNWAGTQNAQSVWTAHPKNLEEIQYLVKACDKHAVKVRCVGSGHSWSAIFPDHDSIFVYMDELQPETSKKRIEFSDKGRSKVDILAGVTTGEFKQFQLDNKVNLPCNVIIDTIQMVSVVATGSHGVGQHCFTPGDYVEKMRIVNSSGHLVTYTKEDKKDKNMMKAVSANFGLFGIIYDMTIRVEEQTIVIMENRYLSVKDYFYGSPTPLAKLVSDNWSVELFWFPFGSTDIWGNFDVMEEEVYARVGNITENKNDPSLLETPYFYVKQDIKDRWSARTQKYTNKFMVNNPFITPYFGFAAVEAIKIELYPAGTVQQELPHAIHFRKYIHENPVYDLEFAFAIQQTNFDHVLKIIQVVFDKMKGRQYPLNIAMEMRFMKYSTSYLCPAKIGDPSIGGTGQVFYIEILSAVNTVDWKQFSVDVAGEWFKLGGIPHLAKEWPITPNNYSDVRKVLKKPIKDFKKMLEISEADPKRIFLNAHLEKLLYGSEN